MATHAQVVVHQNTILFKDGQTVHVYSANTFDSLLWFGIAD